MNRRRNHRCPDHANADSFLRTQGVVPLEAEEDRETLILTVDEYETIRLINREGLSQEQCSEAMNAARTTVQQIYSITRKNSQPSW